MSFPAAPGGPKGLDPQLFHDCYDVLAKKIRDEMPLAYTANPLPGAAPVPDYVTTQKWIEEAEANLSQWLDYALDGDVTMIPGRPDGPWKNLSDMGDRLYSKAFVKWEVAVSDLDDVWSGQGHASAKEYLSTTQDLVHGFCPSVDGNRSGFIPQVASALLDAYATVTAFKMDLYNLAKQASVQIDDLDHGSGEAVGVGLMVAGLALEGVGSAGQASNHVFGQAAGGVLAALGGLIFDAGKEKFDDAQPVGGQDPLEIMDSLVKATRKAAEHYSTAAEEVGRLRLSEIWRELDGKRRDSIVPLRPAAAPDVAIAPSSRLPGLFPG